MNTLGGPDVFQQSSPNFATVTANAPSSGFISTFTSGSTSGSNRSKASKRNLLSKRLDLHSSAAAKNPSTVLRRTSLGVPLPYTGSARVSNTNDGSSLLLSRQAEIDAASDDIDAAPDASDTATNVDVVADDSEVESDSDDTTGTDSLLPRDGPLDG